MQKGKHYGAELARIHHTGFGMAAEAASRELLQRLARAGLSSGTVVELAAGTGILSRRVVEHGFSVWGVDISEDMLAIARKEAPRAIFHTGSLWTAKVPPCVAVTAVGEAFNYAADPTASLEALEERFAAVRGALTPGGVLLFDLACPGRSGPTGRRTSFFRDADVYLGFEEREEAAERRLTRMITLFVREGEMYRRVEETHALRLYAPEDVEARLTRAGFRWERLAGYSDFTFFPGWQGYAATKMA